MRGNQKHSIATIRWETSLDNRELSFQFQEQLSALSRNLLPKVMETTFDTTCPENQFWQIPSVELDLGVIDLDSIQNNLPQKLSEQLKVALVNLQLQYRQGSQEIVVLDKTIARLHALTNFFLHGIPSWGVKHAEYSIHGEVSFLLRNDRENLMAMLRRVGKSENGRKRICWQIREDYLIKILKYLEPNNHGHILNFVNQLTSIHGSAPILQTQFLTFKRNLWFWVCDYLFSETSMTFNVRRMILVILNRMAEHYDLNFVELLKRIENAEKQAKNTSQSSFIITETIEAWRDIDAKKTNSIDQQEDNFGSKKTGAKKWQMLQKYLTVPSSCKTEKDRLAFNRLVLLFSKRDPAKLKTLLRQIPVNSNPKTIGFGSLTDRSLEAILSVVKPSYIHLILSNIDFLALVFTHKKDVINKTVLLKMGIHFVRTREDSPFEPKSFLDYCVSKLVSTNVIREEELFYQLIDLDNNIALKGTWPTDIYNTFLTVLLERPAVDFHKEITALLDTFYKAVLTKNSEIWSKRRQISFAKWIYLKPRLIHEQLLQFPYRAFLKRHIHELFDLHPAGYFIKHCRKDIHELLLVLYEGILHSGKQDKHYNWVKNLGYDLIMNALELLIFKTSVSRRAFITALLKRLGPLIVKYTKGQTEAFVTALLDFPKIRTFRYTKKLLTKWQESYGRYQDTSLMYKLSQKIKHAHNDGLGISQLLLNEMDASKIKATEFLKTQQGKQIQEYLGGKSLAQINVLKDRYIKVLLDQVPRLSTAFISEGINTIYLKCLADCKSHQGDGTILEATFKKGAYYRFPILKTLVEGTLAQENSTDLILNHLINDKEEIKNLVWYSGLYEGLKRCDSKVKTAAGEIDFSYLLLEGLHHSPKTVRHILEQLPISKKRIGLLRTSLSFERFISMIGIDCYGQVRRNVEAIKSLFLWTTELTTQPAMNEWVTVYWEQTWKMVQTEKLENTSLKELLKLSLQNLNNNCNLTSENILTRSEEYGFGFSERIKGIFVTSNPIFEALPISQEVGNPPNVLQRCNRMGMLEELCHELVFNKVIPIWFYDHQKKNREQLLAEILKYYPLVWYKTLKNRPMSISALHGIINSIEFSKFLKPMETMNPIVGVQLKGMMEFYNALQVFTMDGITARELQDWLFQRTIMVWVTGSWEKLSPPNFWKEMVWEFCTVRRISKKRFLKKMEVHRPLFPISFQAGLEQVIKKPQDPTLRKKGPVEAILGQSDKNELTTRLKHSIIIKNAGMVLLNTYFPMLFERMKILKDNDFKHLEDQLNAVHYLQYIVTGQEYTEESFLPLNKVLCGSHPTTPVLDGVELSSSECELMEGLLQAAIEHWSAIGESSLNGFRGNWLVRDGILEESEDRWQLTVEKRAYDLLIHQSPFSFSIIKYPWMKKPLHVKWPY